MFKEIAYRFVLLSVILIILNFIYSKWFYEKDLNEHSSSLIDKIRAVPNDADIIYVGESSNKTTREDDLDKRKISDFIGDYYPKLKVCDITKSASHAGIYKTLLRNIPEDNEVKTVVVTLNMRSFNAQWIYSDLETPLQKSALLLQPYPPLFNRFLLSFKGYYIKTPKENQEKIEKKWKQDEFHLPFDFKFKNVIEWNRWMAESGIKDENGNYDQSQTELACHYIKGYAFQIDTLKNPRIKDFNEIIDLANQRNWNLVFNLLAENTEKAEQLVGEELIYMINKNAQILQDYFSRKGVVVVNNLNVVEDEQFIDQNWTTEHYAEKGRKEIARNVAKSLKTFHSGYIESNNFQKTFFNDCEGNVKWEPVSTISEDRAFSGKKSSKTGNGNDYGITLLFSLKEDTAYNYINIDFMVYQESINNNAKLAVQCNQKNKDEAYFKMFELNKRITESGRWIRYFQKLKITDEIRQADLIKIYIFNPSNTNVYIDDMSVKIE